MSKPLFIPNPIPGSLSSARPRKIMAPTAPLSPQDSDSTHTTARGAAAFGQLLDTALRERCRLAETRGDLP